MPCHFKKCFAIIIPTGVHHPQCARLLSVAYKVNDVFGSSIQVGKDLIPIRNARANKLIQTCVLKRLDEVPIVIAGAVLPVHDDQVPGNTANQIRMMERDVTPKHHAAIVWL